MNAPKPAVRQNVPLLILLAGGTASGKTESALRLATGLAGDGKICVIDTEHGRALHKADDYTFDHAELDEPFTPERYAEAIKAVDELGYSVIVIDSGSHEYEGSGGVLDIQIAEFERMGKKDTARMASWIAPKHRHKTYVQALLRARAHVILAHRAEDKVEVVKEDGKTVVRPKRTLTGAEGWVPICERRLPFEATVSLLLTADAPGVPKAIKLEERHRALVPLDKPLDENVGRALAGWAAGSVGEPGQQTNPQGQPLTPGSPADPEVIEQADSLGRILLAFGKERGNEDVVETAITANRNEHEANLAAHVAWLMKQIERVQAEPVTA